MRDGEPHIYFQESFDGGATWGIDLDADGDLGGAPDATPEAGADMRVHSASGAQGEPTVVASYSEAYVVFKGPGGILCARYNPAGVAPVVLLPAPTLSCPLTAGDTRVIMSWTPPDPAEYDYPNHTIYDYKVKRGTHTTGPYTDVASVPVGTTTYEDTGLTNDTPYYYVVSILYDAVDGTEGENSDECPLPGTPHEISPPIPIWDSPAATGLVQSISLNWLDVSATDFDHYTVYYSKTRGSWSVLIEDDVYLDEPDESDYTWTGPDLNVPYWFVVTSVDKDGNESGYSHDAHATARYAAGDDPTAPAAPTNLSATVGGERIVLDWSGSSSGDVQKYYIYRGSASDGPYSYISAVFSPSTTYTDHGLSTANSYYYVVTAVDGSGNESNDSNEAWGTPLASDSDPAPAAPTNLTATAGNSWIDLNWDDNTEYDFSYYNVYRSTTRGSWTLLTTASASALYDTAVTNGTGYWYALTAVDTEGKKSDYSNDAHATPNATDTTAPDAPTNLGANAADAEISLAWTGSTAPDLATHHVYRSTISGKYYAYLSAVELPSTAYLDYPVTNGITYYYVVTALDGSNNESGDSNEASGTPTGTYGAGTGIGPSPAPAGAAGGGGGGCFIATACYGSPLAREVRVLSIFRDRYLLSNSAGRVLLSAYCVLSPRLAEFISERPLLRFMVRMQLKPWVKLARIIVGE